MGERDPKLGNYSAYSPLKGPSNRSPQSGVESLSKDCNSGTRPAMPLLLLGKRQCPQPRARSLPDPAQEAGTPFVLMLDVGLTKTL